MAYGDIHNKTGTICKAVSDETCPLQSDGHSNSIEDYAAYHSVDVDALNVFVANGANNVEALELIKSGVSIDGVTPSRKRKEETPQEKYQRELGEYAVKMKQYEDWQLAEYQKQLQSTPAFAPRPAAPPLRTVYPQHFSIYEETFSDDLPLEAPQGYNEELWAEYRTKRKRDRDSGREPVYYLPK